MSKRNGSLTWFNPKQTRFKQGPQNLSRCYLIPRPWRELQAKRIAKTKTLRNITIFEKAKAKVSGNNDEGKEWNEMIWKSIDSRLRGAMYDIVRTVNSTLNAVGGQAWRQRPPFVHSNTTPDLPFPGPFCWKVQDWLVGNHQRTPIAPRKVRRKSMV